MKTSGSLVFLIVGALCAGLVAVDHASGLTNEYTEACDRYVGKPNWRAPKPIPAGTPIASMAGKRCTRGQTPVRMLSASGETINCIDFVQNCPRTGSKICRSQAWNVNNGYPQLKCVEPNP
jgi:hypothetical protein